MFNNIKKEKNFIFILFLGLTLRFIQFLLYKDDFLDWDELMTISWNIKYVSLNDLLSFIINSDPHPPLFNIITRPFVLLFDSPYYLMRFLSMFFSSVNIIMMYFIVKELTYSKKNALWAMLFISLNPFQIYQSIMVIPYISFLSFFLLSNFFFLKMLRKNSVFYQTLHILFSLCMFYTHFFASFILLSQFIFYLIKNRRSGVKKHLTVFIIIFLFSFPYLLIAKTSPLNPAFYTSAVRGHISWINKTDYSIFFYRVFNYFNGFFHAKLFNVEGIEKVFFLSLFIILCKEFFLRRRSSKFIILFFMPTLLLIVTSIIYQFSFDKGFLELRHFIILFPFYVIMLSFMKKEFKIMLILIFSILSLTNYIEYSRSELYQAKKNIFDKSEKINIYMHPEYFDININHYLKDYSEKVIFFENGKDLPDLSSTLDPDFFVFVKNMGMDSVESKKINNINFLIETKYSGHIKDKYNIGNDTVVYKISNYSVYNTHTLNIPVVINGEYNHLTKPFHILNTIISLIFSGFVFVSLFKTIKESHAL